MPCSDPDIDDLSHEARSFDCARKNNTDAYVDHVCRRLGVAPDHPLDFGNPQVYLHLARAIAYHENGVAADSISLGTWMEGAELAGLKVEA